MQVWEAIEGRHSVRVFETRAVDRAILERLVRAASLAPSTRNSQPWRFHVATGKARAAVGEIMARTTVHLTEYMDAEGSENAAIARWYSTLGDAPVVIGVSMDKSETQAQRDDSLLSMGTSLENLLLAATDEGLSACVVTFSRWVRDDLKRALGVKPSREFVSLVVLGYAAEGQPIITDRRTDVVDWLE